jgi:hypothetical protein
MLNRNTARRATMAALAAITLSLAVVGSSEPAAAWWHGGWGWHGGWHHGWGWGGGWRAHYWGPGYGFGYGYGGYGYGGPVCPPGMHLGPWGHHCWPN